MSNISEANSLPVAILQKVHAIRTLLIAVGTAKRQIDDAESEYTELRSQIAASLRASAITDPNGFQSLWDWLGYWKANGLATYQSRRDYISALYKPVIEALEAPKIEKPQQETAKAEQSFSVRQGYINPDSQAEITIREEAPPEVRSTVIDIMSQMGSDSDYLFGIASRIGKQSWQSSEPYQSGTSSRILLQRLVGEWEWYLLYDFIERFYSTLESLEVLDDERPERDFEERINSYFRHAGVGWQLQDGKIASRGSEAFEVAVHRALPALDETDLQTARREMHEALIDLSRRPHSDLTGAIHHAMNALECFARTVSGDAGTLGEIIKRNPGLLPKPLDIVVEKAWGYASERARHIKEGREPAREEAELIVGIAATVVTYLAKKI
jgi:hypothetical protein